MFLRVALAVRNQKKEKLIADLINERGIQVKAYGQQPNPWRQIVHDCGDIIILNESFVPSPLESGLALLNNLPEKPTTVILSEADAPESNARLVAAGADVVLYAGLGSTSMVEAFEGILESRRQYSASERYDQKGRFRPELSDFTSLNQSMKMFMEEVQQVVATDSVLLLLGETGVGKEHLAKVIHAESHRSAGPFITVNMAAVPDQLLESEMFGHERGAFTGAVRTRRGAFELAHQGTIFLDEIGELPLHMQAKLLRVLQEHEVTPVGAEKPLLVDTRVLAATNRDLEKEVAEGRFRRDLYYRLNVITLTIPPLRERLEDIPMLIEMLLASLRVKLGRGPGRIAREAVEALCRYEWPGNIRELTNVLERALLLSKGEQITIGDLPTIFRETPNEGVPGLYQELPAGWQTMSLPRVLALTAARVEKQYLVGMLEKSGGRVGAAARMAGIHQRSLYNKMRAYGLDKASFKGKKEL